MLYYVWGAEELSTGMVTELAEDFKESLEKLEDEPDIEMIQQHWESTKMRIKKKQAEGGEFAYDGVSV